LSKEEIDRLFEKQAAHEVAMEEKAEKEHEERLKASWIIERTRPRQFPNDALAKEKRWGQERRRDNANAKLEARSIQAYLERRRRDERTAIIKQGVLEGVIKIHETDYGFRIDTPHEEVQKYLLQHPKFKSKLPIPEELQEGFFLLGAITESEKERARYVRDGLIEEFQAESPSDFMLVDLTVANYVRTMYATMLEMQSIRYADDYRMEMFEIMMEGVQPYIHTCQNQLLQVLKALRARRESPSKSTFTHETYSRTDINLESWGLPLLLALAEITEKKQDEIGIDEIKQTMTKHLGDINAEAITNSWIGYALRRYGFTGKIHANDGNRYSISREKVQMLLLSYEGLKP